MTKESLNDASKETTSTEEVPVISDGCPSWAETLIRKVYLLEIESGAIPNPKQGQWNTKTQEDLLKVADGLERSSRDDGSASDQADALFQRIVVGLLDEDFSAEEIAEMVNRRIPTGTKLNYCSPSEVLETADR